MAMRVLAIGAGGVGTSAALIAKRRDFFEAWVIADYDEQRARELKDRTGDDRFSAIAIDASNAQAVTDACRQHNITHVANLVDPRFVMPIFTGALEAGCNYLDTAMSLSRPHASDPHNLTGIKLGDEQFATEQQWRDKVAEIQARYPDPFGA